MEDLKEKLLTEKEKVASLKEQLKAATKKGDAVPAAKDLEAQYAEKISEYERKLGPLHLLQKPNQQFFKVISNSLKYPIAFCSGYFQREFLLRVLCLHDKWEICRTL